MEPGTAEPDPGRYGTYSAADYLLERSSEIMTPEQSRAVTQMRDQAYLADFEQDVRSTESAVEQIRNASSWWKAELRSPHDLEKLTERIDWLARRAPEEFSLRDAGAQSLETLQARAKTLREEIPSALSDWPGICAPDGPRPCDMSLVQVSSPGPDGRVSMGTGGADQIEIVRAIGGGAA